MQERHSRPPFILPGGEAVPACSPYHMASPPFPSSCYSLSPSLLGVLWMIPGVGVRGGGGLQLLAVMGNTTARSVAFFLYFFPPCFFPFLLPSSSVSVNQVRQKKTKKKNVHLSCKETTTALFSNFGRKALTTTEAGLAGSRGEVCRAEGGGGRTYQGTRHRYLLETARRCLCASENSYGHCWALWEIEI
ncbi:hypothetical protein XENOCAPTIV_013267 [Xenoophorus captivus]|uniref:Uncharacterized protein n=1 Tax=Xenoophorus captivus TaxID=1517983 RepID=A0ABV0RCC5_9TELE